MKRLVIVYSSRSTRFAQVEKEVIQKARRLKGWMILKFEVEEAPVRKNAARLAKILRKGDLVLSAGGDGTATMAMNAILKSGKNAALAVMPFGNFNDFAETLGRMEFKKIIRKFEEGRFAEFYPLEVKVDGRHYIYVGMYFTVGMMAEAIHIFKKPNVRKKLGKARNRLTFSARKLFRWYIKNKRRKDFLPDSTMINGENVVNFTTDYVAINGKSMAGVVPGEGWFDNPEEFWSGAMRNRSLTRMFRKFLKANEGELPGGLTRGDTLDFFVPSGVYVHAEGEGEKLSGISKIEIMKSSEKALRVITL